jgi:Uncharacterized protein conserved in bacteria
MTMSCPMSSKLTRRTRLRSRTALRAALAATLVFSAGASSDAIFGAPATQTRTASQAAGTSPAPTPTVMEEIACRVLSVEPGQGNTRIVTVDRGTMDGLVTGWSGAYHSTYAEAQDGKPARDSKERGKAVLLDVSEQTARARVTMNDPKGDGLVRVGDLVIVKAKVPQVEGGRSLFWRLARLHIDLISLDRATKFVSLRSLRDETAADAAAPFEAMAEDIRYAGREFGDSPQLTAPLKAGRYKNRSVRQVMETVGREDLTAFAQFVLSFPGKYMGRDWKVSEVFATWVLNEAPVSSEELVARLLAVSAPAERLALLRAHEKEIRQEDMVGSWLDMVDQRSRAGDKAGAIRVAELALWAAQRLALPERIAWGHFGRARALDAAGRTKDALVAYDDALKAFRSGKPRTEDFRKGEAFSLNNRATLLYSLGRYQEALEAFEAARAAKVGLKNVGPRDQANTLWGIGDVRYKRGDYTGALAAYEKAAALYEQAGDVPLVTEVRLILAKVYARLGKSDQATKRYQQVLETRRRERDRAGEADTLLKLGDHFWTLGRYKDALPLFEEALKIRRDLESPLNVAATLNSLGRLRWNLGQWEESLAAHQEALAIRQAEQDRAGEAESLAEIGGVWEKTGDYKQALDHYARAEAIYRARGDRSGEARAAESIAYVHSLQKEYGKALEGYTRAVKIYRLTGAKADLASALRNRGIVREALKDYPLARTDYAESLTLRRALKAPKDVADSLLVLGNFHAARQAWPEAEAALKEAATLAAGLGDVGLRAQCLRALARLEHGRFRFVPAQAGYEKALALYRSPAVNDPTETASTLLNLAAVESGRAAFARALALQKEALTLARKSGARAVQHAALSEMGWSQRSLGDLEAAQKLQSEALALAEELGDEALLSNSYHALSALASDRGDAATAVQLSRRALDLMEKSGNDWGAAAAANAMGVFYFRQGDYTRAVSTFTRALTKAEKLKALDTQAMILGNLAETYLKLGDFAQALKFNRRAHEMDSRIVGEKGLWSTLTLEARILREQGEARLAKKDAAGARTAFRAAAAPLKRAVGSARTSGSRAGLSATLMESGALAMAEKRFADADAFLREARALAERVGDKNLLWEVLFEQSRVLEARGQLAQARATRQKCIDVLEEMRRTVAGGDAAKENFIRSKVRVYEAMAALLGRIAAGERDPARRQALAEESLRFVGLARFQILSEQARGAKTGDAELDAAKASADRLVQKQGVLEAQKSEALAAGNEEKARKLDETIASSQRDLKEMYVRLKALEDKDPGKLRFRFDFQSLLRRVQRLPEKTALLIYFPGESQMDVWVYTNQGFKAWKRRAVGLSELDGLVRSFRRDLDEHLQMVEERKRLGRGFGPAAEADESNPAWYRENARRMRGTLGALYGHLIAPVLEQIDDAETLLILPYGQLSYLPFEALTRDAGGGNWNFLGAEKRVTYFVGEGHLQRTLEKMDGAPAPARSDVFVAFADPRGSLGSSLDEAQQVAKFFPQHEVYARAEATEERVREVREDATILHFGTHGWLNSRDPNETFLEMAPGEARLPQKRVYDLGEMPCFLKEGGIRLVTLSACQTALAQGVPDAEVLGMPDGGARRR